MTLANTVFSILPGVFRPCPTLANAVFSILPGLRNENRPKYPLFFVLPVVAHIVTSISAPPTSFPAALRSSPRRQHHFQRRSSFHCAANVISSGAPLFTAPPTSFPAALHFPPRRQHLFQRCSASSRAANVISNGAPLCTTPLRYYTIAHHQKKRRENPSLSCVRNTLKTVISSESVSPSASGNFDVFLALC